MSKQRILKFIVLPFVLALAITAAAYFYLMPYLQPQGTSTDLTAAVVAREGVAADTRLTAEHLAVKEIPPQALPDNYVSEKDWAVGKIAKYPMVKGEVLVKKKLAGEEVKSDLAYKIPEGFRAITMSTNQVSGVGGFIQPGDHIDLVLTVDDPTTGKKRSLLVLQDILVLAVGGRLDREKQGEGYSHLTLALQPYDAVLLNLAEEKGKMKALLRPVTERGPTEELEIEEGVFFR